MTAAYAAGAGWTLYHGDCRELLPRLPLADVGLVIADPPYQETSIAWDRWPAGWVAAVAGAVATNVPLWCFGSVRMFLAQAPDFAGWSFGQDLVWEKHNGSGFHADRFKRVHEHVLQWFRGPWADVWKSPVTTPDAVPKRIHRKLRPAHMGDIERGTYESHEGGPRLMRSVIKVRSCHGHAVVPTQKPLGIIEPLLSYSLAPGGLVLDPTCGSGSTMLAAVNGGWTAIGIEADERTCEIAALRMDREPRSLWSSG